MSNCDCKTVGEHFKVCRGVEYSEVTRAWQTALNLGTSNVTKEDIAHLEKYADHVQEAIEQKVGKK